MTGGYMEKILFVNLSDGTFEEQVPDVTLYRQYLGGLGLGAKIIFDRQPGGVDPLGPENHIGFVTGPLTGIRGLQGSRFTVVGKSPLTGCWGDANAGGYFGPYLKFSGYDAVFFNGISEKPVYLYINDGKPELRDATHLWGKDTRETDEILKTELGKKTAIACIGPGGEKKSLIAGVIHDTGCAAARAGLGAVLGAKNMKAIAVTGTQKVPVPDKEKVELLQKDFLAALGGEFYERWTKWGTCGDNENATKVGDAPVKNWSGVGVVDFPNVRAIGGDAIIALQKKKHGCLWCPIACKGIMKAGTLYEYEEGSHKPEYETSGSFGMLLLNDNLESIIKANDICNRYGLDTISAGAVIAFAMECYENGILTKEDTEGVELTWGNHEAIVAMTEKLARREGLGDILADGVKKASEKIGKGSEKFAIHACGQEVAMHDPKYPDMNSMLPSYECDAAPGRHTSAFSDAVGSSFMRIMNASGMCMFPFVCSTGVDLAAFVSTATGWNFTFDDILKVGERISNIRQAFTVREGIKPADTVLSSGRVMGDPPLTEGPNAGVTLDAASIRSELFKAMDWDLESGKPSRQKLESLDMQDVAAELWG